jgi:hypothetical protein
LLVAAAYGYWRLAVPVHRVDIQSELTMLGDLDGDLRWTLVDVQSADRFTRDPYGVTDAVAWRLDLNRNGLVDPEDLAVLKALVASSGDPYAAEEDARAHRASFPRPRELYRYRSVTEFRNRPLYALPYPRAADSVLEWLRDWRPEAFSGTYAASLDAAIYDEAVRFDRAWRRRSAGLLPPERD